MGFRTRPIQCACSQDPFWEFFHDEDSKKFASPSRRVRPSATSSQSQVTSSKLTSPLWGEVLTSPLWGRFKEGVGSDFGPGSILLGYLSEAVWKKPGPKIAPRRPQDAPRRLQDASRRPKTPLKPPKTPQRRPQEAPRCLQEASRGLQEASRRLQEAPRCLQKVPRRLRDPRGTSQNNDFP